MALLINNQRAQVMLNAGLAGVNSPPNPGYIEIRDGTRPAAPDSAATGTLLSTCVLTDGTVEAFANATGTGPVTAVGTLTGGVFAEDPDIAASGTATWFRLYEPGGNAYIDGDVGLAASDLILDDVDLVIHGTVSITQFDVSLTGVTAPA